MKNKQRLPIQVLPDDVVRQVAAGEVVDRPASVVKELIENALDAGATQLKVSLGHGGLDYIEVRDNGHGMSQDDLEKCWWHHSTNKISHVTDLHQITTFGFRGEALSSLAAVADLTIISRTVDNEFGHRLVVRGQTMQPLEAMGRPVGTTVRVDNLFAAVPARRKFVQSSSQELRACLRILENFALAYPHVSWQVAQEGKILLHTPATTQWLDRIGAIMGDDFATHLLPLAGTAASITIAGFIGKPQIARRQHKQFVYINGRPVSFSDLSSLLRGVYGTLLEANEHPSYILRLDLPPELVDVNVHPQKTLVRVAPLDELLMAVKNAATTTLQTADIMYKLDQPWRVADSSPQQALGQHLKASTPTWQAQSASQPPEIMQLHQLYLVTSSPEGMVVIDQHAAHERILYEQFLTQWQATQAQPTTITLPHTQLLHLSLSDAALLQTHLSDLEKIGFQIEPWRRQTFALRAIPAVLQDKDMKLVIPQIIDDLQHGPYGQHPHPHIQRLISYLACRTAIKAGEYLEPSDRQRLVERLMACQTQYTCPHGRPAIVEINQTEIAKWFKR